MEQGELEETPSETVAARTEVSTLPEGPLDSEDKPSDPPPRVEEATELVTVQIASLRTPGGAERLLARAEEKTGLTGLVVPSWVSGDRWYRVLLGAFPTEEEARRAVEPLRRERTIAEVAVHPMRDSWRPALSSSP